MAFDIGKSINKILGKNIYSKKRVLRKDGYSKNSKKKYMAGYYDSYEGKILSDLKRIGAQNIKKSYNKDKYGDRIVEFTFEVDKIYGDELANKANYDVISI